MLAYARGRPSTLVITAGCESLCLPAQTEFTLQDPPELSPFRLLCRKTGTPGSHNCWRAEKAGCVNMYVKLARREESEALAEFGEAYVRYAAVTPGFFPRLASASAPTDTTTQHLSTH